MTVPELGKRDYPVKMTIGTLAGSGTLGLLIPPSIIMIVYGVTAEQSIGRLFIAGVVPGLLLVTLFMGYTAIWSLLNKGSMPNREGRISWRERIAAIRSLGPTVALIALVIGSIYGGYATPTEAAVVGVLGALGLSAMSRSLTFESFMDGVMAAVRTSCMISFMAKSSMRACSYARAVLSWLELSSAMTSAGSMSSSSFEPKSAASSSGFSALSAHGSAAWTLRFLAFGMPIPLTRGMTCAAHIWPAQHTARGRPNPPQVPS